MDKEFLQPEKFGLFLTNDWYDERKEYNVGHVVRTASFGPVTHHICMKFVPALSEISPYGDNKHWSSFSGDGGVETVNNYRWFGTAFNPIRTFVRQLKCTHKFRFLRNIYGDEINIRGGYRSIWKCPSCAKTKLERQLHKE